MRLAIVGSRDFTDYSKLEKTLIDLDIFDEITEIVSGGARGADKLAERFASEYLIKFTEYPALWTKHGKAAGFIRNQQIVARCDQLIAFWDHESKGTKHSIKLAQEQDKLLKVVGI